jgi:hypothetical protein
MCNRSMDIVPENAEITAFHAQSVEQMKSKNQVKIDKEKDRI